TARGAPPPRAARCARPASGRLLLTSGGPAARSSRGGGAPRERAGVGPRPRSNNADPATRGTRLSVSVEPLDKSPSGSRAPARHARHQVFPFGELLDHFSIECRNVVGLSAADQAV